MAAFVFRRPSEGVTVMILVLADVTIDGSIENFVMLQCAATAICSQLFITGRGMHTFQEHSLNLKFQNLTCAAVDSTTIYVQHF